jgi:(1->4)-alpha-D-glucan 1-alpha-D-glucosylmutase
MAKGVEDTAFYRYHRLVSLNEVGGDPSGFGAPLEVFHQAMAEAAERWPEGMLTLATHDTKRSGDVRARLNLLSELPDSWAQAVRRWTERNQSRKLAGCPDTNAEYLCYQTLVGTWPIEVDRVAAEVNVGEQAPDVARARAAHRRQPRCGRAGIESTQPIGDPGVGRRTLDQGERPD